MPDPGAEVLAAVYAKLEDDTVLDELAPGGVWTGNAPTSITSYPYVAISFASGSDGRTFTRDISHAQSLYIRAVDKSGAQDACIDVLSRVYDLLNRQTLGVQGFTEWLCWREGRGPFLSPVEAGVQFQNCVDQYRIEVGA